MITKTKKIESGFENWKEYSTDGDGTYYELHCKDGKILSYLQISEEKYLDGIK